MIIRSLKDRLRNKHNIAVAEVEFQDLWQRASLGVTSVSSDKAVLDSTFQAVLKQAERNPDAQLLDFKVEILLIFSAAGESENCSMSTRRQQRVADLIKTEIGNVLLRKLKDPRIGFVTITGVTISTDLQHAKVHFSALGDDEDIDRTLQGLRHAARFIRGEIGRSLELKYCPHLTFLFDESLKEGARIESRLKDLGLTEASEDSDNGDEENDTAPDRP